MPTISLYASAFAFRRLASAVQKAYFANADCTRLIQDWLDYAKLAFDVMYEEGQAGSPKMMTIGLHSRIVGKPARFWALRELIKHIKSHEGVWFATREDIANHWRREHPFGSESVGKELPHFI